MTAKHNIKTNPQILAQPGSYVKARIVGTGVKLGDLAAEAGIAQPTLSHYLAGQRTRYWTQRKIFAAFRRLTGLRIRFDDFWGPLASRRIAG